MRTAVVIGIGINVTLREDELPVPTAGSLALAGAVATDRDPLLRAVLRSLEQWYVRWRSAEGDPAPSGLQETYAAGCATLGRTVRAELPGDRSIVGEAVAVDGDGRLVLATEDGVQEPVGAGDVVHLRPARSARPSPVRRSRTQARCRAVRARPGGRSPPRREAGHTSRTGASSLLNPAERGRIVEGGRYLTVTDRKGSRRDRRRHGLRHGGRSRVDGHDADTGEDPLALRLEQLILGAERRYTPFQAARSAGVSMELASRFWRAMGFADIGQAKALTEADVLALRRLAGLVEAGLLSEAMAVQVARSTGQTTARLAEWQIDSFLEGLTEPPEPGMTRTEVTYPLIELLLPELEEFLVYVWRRQLAAATGRVVQAADDEEMVDRRLAVCFADLVGFTRLTRRLEEEELGELVEAFETTAADLVAANGGRLDQDARRRGAVRGGRRRVWPPRSRCG